MKKNDSSSPINRALDMTDNFALFMAGVIILMAAGMAFIFLPSEAQFAISGILLLIGTALAAHLIHEKIKAMSNNKEMTMKRVATLNSRDIIAKLRSNRLQEEKKRVAMAA